MLKFVGIVASVTLLSVSIQAGGRSGGGFSHGFTPHSFNPGRTFHSAGGFRHTDGGHRIMNFNTLLDHPHSQAANRIYRQQRRNWNQQRRNFNDDYYWRHHQRHYHHHHPHYWHHHYYPWYYGGGMVYNDGNVYYNDDAANNRSAGAIDYNKEHQCEERARDYDRKAAEARNRGKQNLANAYSQCASAERTLAKAYKYGDRTLLELGNKKLNRALGDLNSAK